MLTGGVGTLVPYLNRYNIGNSESSRLHTSIDVNSNDLNNIRTTDTQYIENSRTNNIQIQNTLSGVYASQFSSLTNAINTHGGINLCDDHNDGCGVSISNIGGLYDLGDNWLTVRMLDTGNGLHVSGVSLVVDGDIEAGGNISNNSANAVISKDGRINATKDISGQVIRPNFIAVSGNACSNVSIPSGGMDTLASNNSGDTFTIQNGDIAKDTTGKTLTCVLGVWKSGGSITESFSAGIGGYGWTNVSYSSAPHSYCFLTNVETWGYHAICRIYHVANNYWELYSVGGNSSSGGSDDPWGGAGCTASCID